MPTVVTSFFFNNRGRSLAVLCRAKEQVSWLEHVASSFVGLLVFRLDDSRSLEGLGLKEVKAFATLDDS